LRFYLVIVAVIIALTTSYTSPKTVICGLPLVLLGVALHFWAKGCLHQNLEVTTTGPYRWVRHPFYTANGLVDLGIAVMSGCWYLMILLPIWWLAVYVPVIRGEETHLTELFGEKYTEYKKHIWMLVPFGKPLSEVTGGFSWRNRNITSGKEIPRALRLLAYPLLMLAAAGVHITARVGESFWTAGGHMYLWASIGFVVLHIAATLIEKRLKGRPEAPAAPT
jgi:protein-S-isoprenylcysteine O-methyltransferase Ste14